ncbi:MAG TPA: fibrinogen-like YCDxxxxGGGW domain-containing protein [Polyangiaceae bacterium]|nr:fibrinogen-like YCDxxxxGGGW domain-containing protein [Polyangiaceae bacterium]
MRALLLAAATLACDPIATPIVALDGADAGSEDAGDGGAPDADAPDSGDEDAGDAGPEAGPSCGDGVQQDGEFCDDFANPEPGVGCNADCTAVDGASCGDGVVTEPEVCDGPEEYCDGCQAVLGQCGDGVVQAGLEDCDTTTESASCDADCSSVSCGDEHVNTAAGEVCDDGVNDGSPGGCSSDCAAYALGPESATVSSCDELGAASDGYYWLLAADDTPYLAYCDMTNENGGWTLVMRAIDENFDYYDPLWSNDVLENEASFDFRSPGRSKYRSYLEVPFTELRTSDPDDFSRAFVTATAHPSALALFGANGGEGFGLSLASGADALEPYFDERVPHDRRQWGCRDFIHVGLNLHALLDVTDGEASSANPVKDGHCDWDGGARFGQRVNTCNYVAGTNGIRQCTGNHNGQGWGSFQNRYTPLEAHPIRQLLWVR